ncbi:MAG: TonB-dependent receptor [Bacteroidales bacterium]|nr:TonB-dependent receptor [Bacteroidales bacterium]
MRRKYYILLFSLISTINISAQVIRVEAKDAPLNGILIKIRDNYSVNLSFDNKELAKYKITVDKYFSAPDLAFDYLLKDLPLDYEKHGSVYLFFPKKEPLPKLKSYRISGKIADAEDMESLPFTRIMINGLGIISDEYGNFNYELKGDSLFQLKIFHLGYKQLDTTLNPGLNNKIYLNTSIFELREVIIKSEPIVFSEQTGSQSGLMRINHKVARLIPGNGDNSVFNILRLQPGVLAAGEESNQMIIWGSYEGQSLVNFDGVTIFGLKNYNDNISAVNPYVVKDIRVHKGGFDATMGERVGAIVDITAIDGDKKKAGFNLNINNMTMNLMGEAPLSKKISIVAAFRQTYYNLYSADDLNLPQRSGSHMPDNSIVIKPDYIFRDGNFKFSGQTNYGDSYGLNMFWGQDNFSYYIDQAHTNGIVSQNFEEKSKQYGSRFQYNKLLKGRGTIELNAAYSGLNKKTSDNQSNSGMNMNHNIHSKEETVTNEITELKTTLSGKIRLSNKHELEFGGGFITNSTYLAEDSFAINLTNRFEQSTRIQSYLQERFAAGKFLYLTIGLRANYVSEIQKTFLQPRINISFTPTEHLKFNASWGKYNQFIVLNPIIDQYNNYRYQWMISGLNQIPVLESQHFTLASVFNQKGFSVSIEGYYKETKGISRFISNETDRILFSGIGKTMGIDFFMKQEYNGHTAWISYSVTQALEWFPYFQNSEFQSALHNQRHEIKLATIINLQPFFISANYVYGSGFIPNASTNNIIEKQIPYSRIDVAGIYRFSIKKARLEAGISILNLLNTENIKFSNITQIPTSDTNTLNVYSETVPFTPAIFLNISF